MKAARLKKLLGACAILMILPAGVHAQARGRGPATDAASSDDVQALSGFKVEVVLRADRAVNGSWISAAKDNKGRILLAGQRGEPLTRVTLQDGKAIKTEIIKLPVSEAMGMLVVGDALYMDGNGRNVAGQPTTGLYRLRDPKGDNSFSEVELLREWPNGSGDHGSHAILLAPDKQHLLIVNGNKVAPAPDRLASSPLKNYADDRVIPRAEDTFMAGEKPPGGLITRMDLNGKNPVLLAGGMRNTYDIAINADNEIFGFDSDMEYDWGSPWYRPTRVMHEIDGADFGFRGGSGKYPTYYEDSLPPIVNIGIGSPTGVIFGYGAKFPARYQRAFFIEDWTYGRLMAVHLKPQGSTYEATVENFVFTKSLHSARKVPLNLTDVLIGDDGAMYFSVGGRNTPGCLYRVTYVGEESTAPVDAHDAVGVTERQTRHQLESFHSRIDPDAVATSWPYLSSDDRFMRFAARLAIESQPVAQWKELAGKEANPQGAIEAALALARLGGTECMPDVLKILAKFPITSLSAELQLQKLRVLEVAISRNGKPTGDAAQAIISELDPLYPSYSTPMNYELSQLLLAMSAPKAVDRTVKLMSTARTVDEQIAAMMALRAVETGWTPELRRDYFTWFNIDHSNGTHPDFLIQWFNDAGRIYGNGTSYNGFQTRARAEAVAKLSPADSSDPELKTIMSIYKPPAGRGGGFGRGRGRGGPTTAPGNVQSAETEPATRPFVKDWTMADLEPLMDQVSSGRNFQRGQTAFVVGQCAQCHAMAGIAATNGVGPDLTSIAARFHRHDILESIVDPSKTISDQFADVVLNMKNSTVIVGHIAAENDDIVSVQPNVRSPERVDVKKSDIERRGFSKTSPMPNGLINNLDKDDILDLMAYLESGGRPDHPDFSK